MCPPAEVDLPLTASGSLRVCVCDALTSSLTDSPGGESIQRLAERHAPIALQLDAIPDLADESGWGGAARRSRWNCFLRLQDADTFSNHRRHFRTVSGSAPQRQVVQPEVRCDRPAGRHVLAVPRRHGGRGRAHACAERIYDFVPSISSKFTFRIDFQAN